MTLQELYDACTAAGYRPNAETGMVDGVTHGIAWRLSPEAGTLDLSVSISEKNLQKWTQDFAGGTVAYYGYGVRLTAAGMANMTPEALVSYIDGWTAYAEGAAASSFDNKFQSYREPLAAYFRGAAGALLGALVGVIPWVLSGFLGFQLWIFGILVSVAAFYGYRQLRGAHATGFAVGAIVIASLLAVFVGEVVGGAFSLVLYSETPITFWAALSACLTPAGLIWVAQDAVFGLLCCALGFFGIRGKVMEYTHERGYLRRRK